MKIFDKAKNLFKRRPIIATTTVIALLAAGAEIFRESQRPDPKENTTTFSWSIEITPLTALDLDVTYGEWLRTGKEYHKAWVAHETAKQSGDVKKEQETRVAFEATRNEYFESTQGTYNAYVMYCATQSEPDATACAPSTEGEIIEGNGSRLLNLSTELNALREEIQEDEQATRRAGLKQRSRVNPQEYSLQNLRPSKI